MNSGNISKFIAMSLQIQWIVYRTVAINWNVSSKKINANILFCFATDTI